MWKTENTDLTGIIRELTFELIAARRLHAPWIIVLDFLARARASRILNPNSLLTHANGECEKLHVTNKFVAYFYTYVSEMQNTHARTREE